MNVIVKTETSHPVHPKAYPLWLKHHFKDGSWVCIHKTDKYPCIAVDFGKDKEIDGWLHENETSTWDYYHSLVVDLIAGVQQISILTNDADETYISIEPGKNAQIGS